MLTPLAEQGIIRLPIVPQHCTPNYHMFYIITADIDERTALIAHLWEAGILAVFHYVPLHSSPFGQSIGSHPGMLPVTEQMSERLLRLPFCYDMSEADVASVCEAIRDFYHLRAY